MGPRVLSSSRRREHPRFGRMALPPLIKQVLDAKLSSWCDALVPAHIRDELRYEHGIREDAATIFEVRPHWDEKPGSTQRPCAQIRYEDDLFVLYCADRDARWHVFEPVAPTRDLDEILAAVEEDPTGIFFG